MEDQSYTLERNNMQPSFDRPRQHLKVMLVEDDEDDYILTQELLSEITTTRFEVEWITNYKDALYAIRQNRHDVVLSDYRLGGHSGLELLREALELGCRSPIILLTGQGGYEVDISASEAGAADYLVKSQITSNMLERSIRYAINNYKKAAELQKQIQHLKAKVDKEEFQQLEEAINGLRGMAINFQ